MKNVIFVFMVIGIFMVSCGGSNASQSADNQLDVDDVAEIELIEQELDSLQKEEEILDELNEEIENLLSDLE